MAADSFSETSTTGWFSRIAESIKGILFGIVLICGAVFLLFWNEGRSVTTYKTLKEGAGLVVSVNSAAVDPQNEGKLVHMSGLVTTTEVLEDPDFSVSLNALKLRREVEMYQWEEKKETKTSKNTGGSETTTTTYDYNKVWSSDLIDSSEFKKSEEHQNPSQMAYESETWVAEDITMGAFKLSPGLVSDISNFEDISPSSPAFSEINIGGVSKTSKGYYVGGSPEKPAIGDLRITFQAASPADMSLISKQLGNSFEPYVASAGGHIEILSDGVQSAANMFAEAQSQNTMLTWGLRIFGFMLTFFGFALILRPLSVVADILPIFGNIVGIGTSFVAGIAALVVSLVTISIAWFFYRPVLSIGLIVVAGGAIWYLMKSRKNVGTLPSSIPTTSFQPEARP